MAAGEKQYTDKFGRPKKFGKLCSPKGSAEKGFNASISGISQGYVEIGNDLFKLKVHGTKSPKFDGHNGGFELVKLPKRAHGPGF